MAGEEQLERSELGRRAGPAAGPPTSGSAGTPHQGANKVDGQPKSACRHATPGSKQGRMVRSAGTPRQGANKAGWSAKECLQAWLVQPLGPEAAWQALAPVRARCCMCRSAVTEQWQWR